MIMHSPRRSGCAGYSMRSRNQQPKGDETVDRAPIVAGPILLPANSNRIALQ
jgi:hypothetical protein